MKAPEALLPEACVGRDLQRVELDLTTGGLCLVLDGGTVDCKGIHSCNLLGPWDGAPGRIAGLRVRRVEGLLFLEWRVEYPEVPRHYRVVCREAGWRATDGSTAPVTS